MTINSGRLSGAEGWIVREKKLLQKIATLTRERDAAIKTNNNLAIENIRLSSECETLRHVCEVSSGTQYTLEATEEKLDFAKLEIDRLMQDVATERHSASVSDEVCVAEMQARKAAEAERDAAIARAEDKSELASLALATRDEWEREALALRALLRETGEALHLFQQYGCPVCHGDCASANPPVLLCPMQTAHDLAARIAAATQTETGGEDE